MIYTIIGKIVVGIGAFLASYCMVLGGVLLWVDRPPQHAMQAHPPYAKSTVRHSMCESRLYRSLHRHLCVLVFVPNQNLFSPNPNPDAPVFSVEWRSEAELGLSEWERSGGKPRRSHRIQCSTFPIVRTFWPNCKVPQ
jgi:hypothetical protein